MKKKLLFVINTLSRAGAEAALIELLRKIDSGKYEICLYVITGQGELRDRIPGHVKLLNPTFSTQSVLTEKGRGVLMKKVCLSFVRNGRLAYKFCYAAKNFAGMVKRKRIQTDKLFWRVLSDGADRFQLTFDLAVAWIEGGSAYFVADYVKARKKAALIHIDYENAGYTREMDQGCFEKYENIFAVSEETKRHFLRFYPEYAAKVDVFDNIVNQDLIRLRAREKGGFSDGYEGFRILSAGRLTWQKGFDMAIEAMKLLKKKKYRIRWYVLGEGEKKKALQKKIKELELEKDFLLLGQTENPYPYYMQADLYVHATRYEGKSIAVQEAQTLIDTMRKLFPELAVRNPELLPMEEQLSNGADGILCGLAPREIAEKIEELYLDEEKRKALGEEAKKKEITCGRQLKLFQELLE